MKLSYPTLLISYMFVFDIYVKVSHAPSFFIFHHSNTRVSTLVFFSASMCCFYMYIDFKSVLHVA